MKALETLNPQQKEAVCTPEQHVLVLAGAGSGKTKVLTTRIAWLLSQGLVSPYGILAVTFTNKAANEMKARLQHLLPMDLRTLWIGTFHGLCNRLLRLHARDAGLPQQFQILDMADQLAMIKRVAKARDIVFDTESGQGKRFTAKEVQHFINKQKDQGLRPRALVGHDHHENHLIDMYHYYQEQCDKEGVVDFPELLLRTVELLSAQPQLRAHYQARFQHVLVDEFQDTNNLQYRWLQLLLGAQSSMFAVGDDDQSIYAFRGANVHNMRAYERDYAKGHIVRLEQNYRSDNHILKAANHLIAHNQGRFGKSLWSARGEGERIRLNILDNEKTEADWVAQEIKQLIQENGYLPEHIAILYRSNAQSRALEHALKWQSLPFRIYGGLRFYDRQEIKHMLAYLRLVFYPHDNNAFLRVVNVPARGIGTRSLEKLQSLAQSQGGSLFAAIDSMTGVALPKLQSFKRLIHHLQSQAQQLDLMQLAEQVLHDSGLLESYEGTPEYEDRRDNLYELLNACKAFMYDQGAAEVPALQPLPLPDLPEGLVDPDEVEHSCLGAFLAYSSLETGEQQTDANESSIQLMTVHAAKGLEFEAVFVTGLEQGLFPHRNSLGHHQPEALEEERRLMYVAMTRAMHRLYLTAVQIRTQYGRSESATLSQFVEEIPEAQLQWLCAKAQSPSPWTFSAPPVAHRLASSSHPSSIQIGEQCFTLGCRVLHPRFGEGVIQQLQNLGNDSQAHIHFHGVGNKVLLLRIAPLQILKD